MIRSRLVLLAILVTVAVVPASGGGGHATEPTATQRRVAALSTMGPAGASAWAAGVTTGEVGLAPAAPPTASCRQLTTPRSGWSWPVDPPVSVLAVFDPPELRWGAGHRGIDLAAAVGESIRAPADGVVSFAGSVAGRPVLVVAHAGGLRSTFEPVLAGVAVGQQVSRGSVVGSLDGTPGHCPARACVHWGVLRGEVYLDPLAMLCGQVVLKPMADGSPGHAAVSDRHRSRRVGPAGPQLR